MEKLPNSPIIGLPYENPLERFSDDLEPISTGTLLALTIAMSLDDQPDVVLEMPESNSQVEMSTYVLADGTLLLSTNKQLAQSEDERDMVTSRSIALYLMDDDRLLHPAKIKIVVSHNEDRSLTLSGEYTSPEAMLITSRLSSARQIAEEAMRMHADQILESGPDFIPEYGPKAGVHVESDMATGERLAAATKAANTILPEFIASNSTKSSVEPNYDDIVDSDPALDAFIEALQADENFDINTDLLFDFRVTNGLLKHVEQLVSQLVEAKYQD